MKKLLLKIALILSLIIGGGYLILMKPYESLHQVRRDGPPVTLLAEYVNVTGDPNCTKLYVASPDSGSSTQHAVFPAFPVDLPVPDDGIYAYHGNQFELTGFQYEWVLRNGITGSEQRMPSRRIDVIHWELLQPYSVWLPAATEDYPPSIEKRDNPVSPGNKSGVYPADSFGVENYLDCLAE